MIVQADQHLCFLLPREYNLSSLQPSTLASVASVSYLVEIPGDMFLTMRLIYEPCHDKTCLWEFRPGPTHTRL